MRGKTASGAAQRAQPRQPSPEASHNAPHRTPHLLWAPALQTAPHLIPCPPPAKAPSCRFPPSSPLHPSLTCLAAAKAAEGSSSATKHSWGPAEPTGLLEAPRLLGAALLASWAALLAASWLAACSASSRSLAAAAALLRACRGTAQGLFGMGWHSSVVAGREISWP